MSSVGRDIAETLTRSTGMYTIEQIASILQMINRRTTPQDEDDALIKHVIYSPLVDVMGTDVTFAESDLEGFEDLTGHSGIGMRKFIPDEVRAYDLTHDNSNGTGITYPYPRVTVPSYTTRRTENSSTRVLENGGVNRILENGVDSLLEIGRKLFAGGRTDGNSYMIIDDHSWWNNTDEFMFSGYLYLSHNSGSDEYVFHKGSDQFGLKTMSGNTLRFEVEIGGTTRNLDYSYTPYTWIQVVAQAKSGDQELWIDNTLEDSAAHTGTIGTNTTDVGIFGTAAGGNLLGIDSTMAWISFANGFGDATWISDYFTKNFWNYDTDVAGTPEEITTIPFLGSLQEMPNSFEGMFIAS